MIAVWLSAGRAAPVTRPTARVLALLEILQSGGTHTVASLAARLDVDERTARRYAAHLIDLGNPGAVDAGPIWGLPTRARVPDAAAHALRR